VHPAAVSIQDDNEPGTADSTVAPNRAHRRRCRKLGVDPLYLQPAAACERWGIGKTSLYKALNRTLPGCELLPEILVVKFGAATLIHVPTGDAFFNMLPRYTGKNASVQLPETEASAAQD
jgi:hypothetical protein